MIRLLYFNNYLDRTNIAQARLAPTSIDDALNLTGDDYNTAVSVLTAGPLLSRFIKEETHADGAHQAT